MSPQLSIVRFGEPLGVRDATLPPEWEVVGGRSVGEAVAAAAGERLLLLDAELAPEGGLEALARAHLAAAERAPDAVLVGAVCWADDARPGALDALLDDASVLLARRSVRDGERVVREAWEHVSLPASLIARIGGFDPALEPRWQRIAAWRALLAAGARPSLDASLVARRGTHVEPTEHLERLRAFADGALAAYLADPELLPRVTKRYGPMLPPGPTPRAMSRIEAFDLLGRATRDASVDEALLDRLEDRLLFDAVAAGLREVPAPADFLPDAYAAAMALRREDRAAAAAALAPLQERSPLVIGMRRARLLLEAAAHAEAEAAALELARALGWHPAPYVLAGEAALIVGQLDRAEAIFAEAYERSAARPIEIASAVAALFARYGPAPGARPHLERIVDDREGRSGRDHRELIAPAMARLDRLP